MLNSKKKEKCLKRRIPFFLIYFHNFNSSAPDNLIHILLEKRFSYNCGLCSRLMKEYLGSSHQVLVVLLNFNIELVGL